MRRALLSLPVLLIASGMVSPLFAAGWKKPYFGSTPPGSWARYTDSSPDMKMTTTMKRLDNEEGQARVELLVEFADNQYPPVHNNYTLRKDFPVERRLIDYMSGIQAGSASAGDAEATVFDDATLAAIVKNAPRYEPTATFVGTETMNGKKTDHYTYTVRYESQDEATVPSTTESGDLWLCDTVPFGLVKQTSVTKDDKGNVTTKYERVLVASDLKP